MTFKLDENLGTKTKRLFLAAGHDVQTVRDQGLSGCSDERLYELCCAEKRCLVTLDMDFADVVRFPPAESKGIVIIRLPKNPNFTLLQQLIQQFLQALTQMSVGNRLWVIEAGRIRIHQSETE